MTQSENCVVVVVVVVGDHHPVMVRDIRLVRDRQAGEDDRQQSEIMMIFVDPGILFTSCSGTQSQGSSSKVVGNTWALNRHVGV